MDATISTKLAELAAHLRNGAPPHEVAAVLDQLAAHTLVALPDIDTLRDDLSHWQYLSDQRLLCENNRDAWCLAAGVAEESRRRSATTRRLWGVT